MNSLQNEINRWQVGTFGDQHADHYFKKLKKEFRELQLAHKLRLRKSLIAAELADCLIVLIGLAGAKGINAGTAVRAKLKVLRRRKWRLENDGTFQHVEE